MQLTLQAFLVTTLHEHVKQNVWIRKHTPKLKRQTEFVFLYAYKPLVSDMLTMIQKHADLLYYAS